MKLTTIATGSTGNCYMLEENGKFLILEAGVRFEYINRLLKGNVANVEGLLLTHEHGDHAKYAGQYLDKGIRCFCSSGTKSALKEKRLHAIKKGYTYKLNSFKFTPFLVSHNAKEPFCYAIESESSGRTLFATDLNNIVRFPKNYFNHLLIEANYCENVLMSMEFDGVGSIGTKNHLSVQQAAIMANSDENIMNVILLHRSKRTSAPEQESISHFEYCENVQFATPNKIHELLKTPF